MHVPPHNPARRRRPNARWLLVAVLVLTLGATACMPPLVDPPTSGRNFGQGPLEAVYDAASANATCGLTAIQLSAMMIAVTYGEAGGPVPSPMTLSRWDNVGVNSSNANLFAFGQTTGPYVNAFFSPGIGMWQFDSAGGWPFSAAGAIDSVTSANQAASTISSRWCNAPTSQKVDDATHRKYAWGPWFGCSVGTPSPCEAVFASLDDGDKLNSAFDATVTRYGGMQQRSCNLEGVGQALTCWYVNPALAQGSRGWTGGTYNGTSSGVTPLPKPFYVVEANGREYRIWLPADTGYDTGITASKPITLNARTSLTWSRSAGLCDLTAARGQCSGRVASTPWGPKVADPFGNLEAATAGVDRTVSVSGWAIDPDTNDPVDVHVYVDGTFAAAAKASLARPDVAAVVPGYGTGHGYALTLSGVAPGAHQVCAYAINAGPNGANNPSLGCLAVSVPGEPFGSLDVVASSIAGARVSGWVIDPDSTDPVEVRVLVDGVATGTLSAADVRPDVGGAYPWAGAAHGFSGVVPTAGGVHEVCVVAANIGPTGTHDSSFGCGTVAVDGSPIGSFEIATTGPGGVNLQGWAFDPDTSAASVRVTVDGSTAQILPTDEARPDVGAAYPGRGSLHGFAGVVRSAPGRHQVCVTIVNQGATGVDRPMGCRSVDVLTGTPFGNIESVVRNAGTARISGWVIDPDVAGPVQVHVYVNGGWAGAYTADGSRPDVGAAYVGWGPAHGIDLLVGVPPSPSTVCIYAIDQVSLGTNPLLACRTV